MAAELHTDFPERFADRRRLFALDQSGSRRELHLEDFWPHKEWLILKFQGIDSINDAEPLIGCEIQIPAEERASLENDATYTSDLVGCRVFVSDLRPTTSDLPARDIGVITGVTFGAGEAPILEIKEGKKEYLVPLAQEYVKTLDVANKRLELALPGGMLELDAPLSADEKKAQHNPEND